MDWLTVKRDVYFEDGSLRDIVADGMSLEKWELLCSFLEENDSVRVRCDGSELDDDFNYSLVDKMLSDNEHSYVASFNVCNVILHTYFWDSQQLEFDLSPNDVDSFEKHTAILSFMKQLATILQVKIKMTGESWHDMSLMEVTPSPR